MKAVQMSPVAKIHIVNPRARTWRSSRRSLTNVATLGLKRPVTVRPRPDSDGEYDLVCPTART
jgi:ParB family chromosome partitioning protein